MRSIDLLPVIISDAEPNPRYLNSYPRQAQVRINIGDMNFRVVIGANDRGGNIWWGIIPKTNTRNKINQYRDKNNHSGIMKILIPGIKKAIYKLLEVNKGDHITIEGKSKKAQNLYKSWKNIHPDYNIKITNYGIELERS